MITWSFNYMCVSVVQIQWVRERPHVSAGFQVVSEGDIQRERETNRVPAAFDVILTQHFMYIISIMYHSILIGCKMVPLGG